MTPEKDSSTQNHASPSVWKNCCDPCVRAGAEARRNLRHGDQGVVVEIRGDPHRPHVAEREVLDRQHVPVAVDVVVSEDLRDE